MSRFISMLILLGVIGFSVFTIRQELLPACEKILYYDIGTIDSRFGLSNEEFLHRIQQAEDVWESELKREVFEYKPGSPFSINLVYDERQEQTEERQTAESQLSSRRLEITETQQTLDTQEQEYKAKAALYEQKQAAYVEQQEEYNDKVEYWNNQGGAPPSAFAELENDRRELISESQSLERLRQEVNFLAAQVNSNAGTLNDAIGEYNQYVQTFNSEFGTGESFDQGIFNGKGIDIYQFESLNDLDAVLTHEFGHALGLDHVDDLYAVMYFQQHDSVAVNLKLTDDDRAELARVCSSYR